MTEKAAQPIVCTLADMLAAGRYDKVNSNITGSNFPVRPALFTTEGSKLFRFKRGMTMAQVEAAIRAEGCEPDPIEKLLAYGAAHPEEQRKYLIVGGGSWWVSPLGDRFVPYLCERDRERHVSLLWGGPKDQCCECFRFLASGK